MHKSECNNLSKKMLKTFTAIVSVKLYNLNLCSTLHILYVAAFNF